MHYAKLLCLIYVDDIIIIGSNTSMVYSLITRLQSHFAIKNLGKLHYFLNIEVTWGRHGCLLHQTKYIKELLLRFGMSSCGNILTPSSPANKLTLADIEKFHDETLFRSVVGGL